MTFLFFLFWTLAMALKLSAIRWIQMIFYWPTGQQDWIWKTLVTGFRFDLLIIGYWLAPLVVVMAFKKIFTGRGLQRTGFVKLYLVLSWVLICALYFRDFLFFSVHREHMWSEDHQTIPFLTPQLWAAPSWWVWLGAIVLIFGLLQAGLFRFDSWMRRLKDFSSFSLVLIVLWTVLLCRGSVGSDHLRRNDCDYALNSTVKSLCMNPAFMFTKERGPVLKP